MKKLVSMKNMECNNLEKSQKAPLLGLDKSIKSPLYYV